MQGVCCLLLAGLSIGYLSTYLGTHRGIAREGCGLDIGTGRALHSGLILIVCSSATVPRFKSDNVPCVRFVVIDRRATFRESRNLGDNEIAYLVYKSAEYR